MGEGNQLSMWMANVVECCVVICSVFGSSFVLQSNAKCTHEEVYIVVGRRIVLIVPCSAVTCDMQRRRIEKRFSCKEGKDKNNPFVEGNNSQDISHQQLPCSLSFVILLCCIGTSTRFLT